MREEISKELLEKIKEVPDIREKKSRNLKRK